jgi:acyl carrier protein phosphodiesterase
MFFYLTVRRIATVLKFQLIILHPMNLLAHVYLSGNDPGIMVGNFMGDFVKGKDFRKRYPSPVVKGIELHRAIDSFTDDHSIVDKSKSRLRPTYRHYSGVIVDMFYDHFLAKNWSSFHHEPLPDFAEKTYRIIGQHASMLPQEAIHMMPYMVKGNWLVNYANVEGIQRALTGMSRRTKFNSKMDEAANDLVAHYTDFEQEFMMFFPELKAHAEKFLGQSLADCG